MYTLLFAVNSPSASILSRVLFPPYSPPGRVISRVTQFYGFLRRGRLASRSAPKKRRSRSADEIAEMVEPLRSTISLANDSQSVQDHGSTFAPPSIRRGPVASSSRPQSTATVTQKRIDKKLPQLPPDTTASAHHSVMSSTHVIGEPERPKPRKKTFFGMISLPNSRRSSVSKSRPATPTPDNTLNPRHRHEPDLLVPSPPPPYHDLASIPLNDTTNYRWNGNVAGQRSQPSFDISEPDSGLGVETVVTRTKLVTIVSSQPQPHLEPIPDVPIRISPTPQRTARGVEKSRRVGVEDTLRPPRQDPSTSGRTSPLMKMFGGKKGKEREGSVDRGKGVRMATPASASENERGQESQNSNRDQGKPNNANISGPMNLKAIRGRIKHGSFDFERPLSTSVGHPVRSARWSSSGSYRTSNETDRNVNGHGNGHLWNATSSSTYPIQEERSSLTRSQSARESSDHHHQDRGRGQTKIRFADEAKGTQTRSRSPYDTRAQPQHSSLPSKSTGRGPGVLKNSNPVQAQTKLPYRPEGGSWGRNTSKRAGMGGTGYIDGLPSFGMSVTSLHLDGDVNGPSSRSNSPQIATIPMDRAEMKRKGRSLDLGLGLSWAPTRVKEEAVMDFSEIGVRSKWREEAEVKESGRMEVLDSFERVLGENGYAKFKECTPFPFSVSVTFHD